MIHIKKKEEIELMKIGGSILSETLSDILEYVKPGVSELELDQLAERLILERGAEPGFKKVPGYHHTICISTNDVVVHGVPTNRKLKEGDIVGIDCGVYYKGWNTDMAQTLRVKSHPPAGGSNLKSQKHENIDKFLNTGRKALVEAIKQARGGNRVGHISKTIQDIIEGAGYSVVRSLVGHGVGRSLHEEPEVPGYLVGKIEDTPILVSGMTIAVEVIYNMGKSDVVYKGDDNWTIATKDGSLSGLFERTVLITENEPVILTKRDRDST